MDMNNVMLIGRLTKDAEFKLTASGLAICKFALAVNRRKKVDYDWVDEAHFFDITVFGKTAESVSQYLVKGKQVAISGELRQERWQDNNGQMHSKVSISAERVQLLGGYENKKPERQNNGDIRS